VRWDRRACIEGRRQQGANRQGEIRCRSSGSEKAAREQGRPRNLGGLRLSRAKDRVGPAATRARALRATRRARSGANERRGTGIASRENTRPRDANAEVGACRSSDEAGEPKTQGPGGAKGKPARRNRRRERWSGQRAVKTSHRDSCG